MGYNFYEGDFSQTEGVSLGGESDHERMHLGISQGLTNNEVGKSGVGPGLERDKYRHAA